MNPRAGYALVVVEALPRQRCADVRHGRSVSDALEDREGIVGVSEPEGESLVRGLALGARGGRPIPIELANSAMGEIGPNLKHRYRREKAERNDYRNAQSVPPIHGSSEKQESSRGLIYGS